MPAFDALVLSCEHGGNRVPAELAEHFAGAARLLASHRGFDRGALALARILARRLHAPLVATTVSRLVVDANRSIGNPAAWSRFTRGLPASVRRRLASRHHQRHRSRVVRRIDAALGRGRVLHLGVHSFTPVLAGVARRTHLGLLYDPGRAGERRLCASWKQRLREIAPELRVRRNHPYRGDADGLTTALRRCLPAGRYLGVELELSQRLVDRSGAPDPRAVEALVASLRCLRRA